MHQNDQFHFLKVRLTVRRERLKLVQRPPLMQSNLREAIALGLGFRNELLRIYLVISYCNDLMTLLLSLSLSSLYFYVVVKTRGHPYTATLPHIPTDRLGLQASLPALVFRHFSN